MRSSLQAIRTGGLIFLALSVLLSAFSMQAQAEETKIPIELYGVVFHVDPDSVEVDGARMSYDDVKAYVPAVLTQMRKQANAPEEVTDHIAAVVSAYEALHNRAIFTLARRMKHFMPKKDMQDIEVEIADSLRAGQWKALANKYRQYSKSIPPQVLEAQKLHNKYLAVFYLYNMLVRSDEIKEIYADEWDESHDHEHGPHFEDDSVLPMSHKYEYGFAYRVVPSAVEEGHNHDHDHGHEGDHEHE